MYNYEVYLCDELYERFSKLKDAVRCAEKIKGLPYTWVTIYDIYGKKLWYWIY